MSLKYPEIIQGGMGVDVSCYKLANVVSRSGELGIVSGTGMGVVAARRLQNDDVDYVRAVEHFPDAAIAERVLKKYHVPGGKDPDKRFKPVPMYTPKGPLASVEELVVVGNFAAVYLAKEDHDGIVGVNYLEKLQRPHLASIYGAMLAGVDYVVMGAGIPVQIPGVLDTLALQQSASYNLDVVGAKAGEFQSHFSPQKFSAICAQLDLSRPNFLPIISSDLLAKVMTTKASGPVQGFIVEGPTAGGHNAPPRKVENKIVLNERGEPVYGEKDAVNFEKLRQIGLPFWVAGSYASPEGLAFAHSLGAVGVQIGSAFALSEESGLDPIFKAKIRQLAYLGQLDVFTDPKASPSGYPFKVVQIAGSISNLYLDRPRLCDIGYLQTLARGENGELVLRCPAEPVDDFLAKGGTLEETIARKCLCNGLFSALGLGQRQPNGHWEMPIFTLGDNHPYLQVLMNGRHDRYGAADVIAYLRGQR